MFPPCARIVLLASLAAALTHVPARAALAAAQSTPREGALPTAHLAHPEPKLIDKLSRLREEIVKIERGLFEDLRDERSARANMQKIQILGRLQKKERELAQVRMLELQATVHELEGRRLELGRRTLAQQAEIRGFLAAIERSIDAPSLLEHEKMEAPRRRVLANLVERGLKEIEEYHADLFDADKLEREIQEEKRQLGYLFEDLDEQETILDTNKRLQADLLRRREGERSEQLENYRKLRRAEVQVEDMLKDFNSHAELEKTLDAEREASHGLREGAFAMLRGHLPLPVAGRVLSVFGKAFDSESQLYVFHKGITLESQPGESVKAVSGGRVAYAGELPDYGQVAIVDHGDHYYTLCAHLGELRKRTGDTVAAGDPIGLVDESGTPVYFEIRDRNIAVNPLQWVTN